ncbi:MAG: FAD-binding oxidoreductase [Polyangiaceae bacterium]|jgi:alkyldihydroxyacetonephosphate synthase|nr:FAD-binding oxidoreductase [Polyangiaceae bacterium]
MSERARSHWAWGYVDQFPSDDERRELAARVAFSLGVDQPALRPLPSPAEARVSARRVEVPASIAAFCTGDDGERVRHTYGRGYHDLVRGFRGDFAGAPDLVAFPRDEGEVALALEACERAGVACIPYGGGTSVVRGVEAEVGGRFAGALSLDLRHLSGLLEVDPVSRAARVGAGTLGPALEAALAPHGFSLRHFPQSFEFSTVGGWVATRAGGHFATLYTHIDDLVESLRMVTPRGVLATRRLPASGAGPSPERLLLGSEGAFGVITEAWLRVQARPRFRSAAALHFGTFEAAVEAVRAIAQAGLHPSNCRLLDATEALLNGVTFDGSCVVLLGFESADAPQRERLERALALGAGAGGACPKGPSHREGEAAVGDQTSRAWRDAFIRAPYLQSALVSLGMLADTFETACTWDALPRVHEAITTAVRAALEREAGVGVLSCRFTHVYPDGPAPYYTFVAPARHGDEIAQWQAIKDAASQAIVGAGATITHHHAVGRLHRPWYEQERPALFGAALEAAKASFDPAGVMNPGALLPPRSEAGPTR